MCMDLQKVVHLLQNSKIPMATRVVSSEISLKYKMTNIFEKSSPHPSPQTRGIEVNGKGLICLLLRSLFLIFSDNFQDNYLA